MYVSCVLKVVAAGYNGIRTMRFINVSGDVDAESRSGREGARRSALRATSKVFIYLRGHDERTSLTVSREDCAATSREASANKLRDKAINYNQGQDRS